MEVFNSQAPAWKLLWAGFAGFRFSLGCCSRCLDAGKCLWWCRRATMGKWKSLLIQHCHLIMGGFAIILFLKDSFYLGLDIQLLGHGTSKGRLTSDLKGKTKQNQKHWQHSNLTLKVSWQSRNSRGRNISLKVRGLPAPRLYWGPFSSSLDLGNSFYISNSFPQERTAGLSVCLLLCVCPIVGCLSRAVLRSFLKQPESEAMLLLIPQGARKLGKWLTRGSWVQSI